MVVMTHNPEAGPVASESARESVKIATQQREQVMSKLGIKEIGEWIDMPGHVAYLLVDAANSHVITQMLAEGRNTPCHPLSRGSTNTTAIVVSSRPSID